MTKNQSPPRERLQTDSSLSKERQKTDEELAKRRSQIEETADEVLQKARERADNVLNAARSRAQAKLVQQGSANALERVRDEQAVEDTTLTAERAAADALLIDERTDARRALAELFHLEREHTDKHLLIERARSDELLAKRDDFLGMVSHDLRTILGGIALRAAHLKKHASGSEVGNKGVKDAEAIQRYCARMNRLIGDLIDVTSIESGRLAVAPERHDAVKLIRDAMEIFQPLAAEKEVGLEAEIVQHPLLAKFDHERILQVLGNLLSNAIKFTPARGHIRVRVEADGTQVRFSVTDTGLGVPPDKMEAIFERFWQVAAYDRRGLGLGLFISKCIVDVHGGTIWVEASSGKGSTFCFTLPGALEAESA